MIFRNASSILAITLLVATSSWAQSGNAVSVEDALVIAAERNQLIADVRALLAVGDIVSAEKLVRGQLKSDHDSGSVHLRAAAIWMPAAFSVQQAGDHGTAQLAAAQALADLAKAEKKLGNDTAVLAMIWELRGTIRDRLLGTTEQAIECYKAAVRLDPKRDSARAKLKRLQAPELSNVD